MTILLQYRSFPLSEVKNVLVTAVGTKIFVGAFCYCVLNSEGLLRKVLLYMCSLVMNPISHDFIKTEIVSEMFQLTYHVCSIHVAPGFQMVEHKYLLPVILFQR